MVICLCHRVSESDIARAAGAGCTSFAALQDDTGIATACGACLEQAAETFASHHPAAAAAGNARGLQRFTRQVPCGTSRLHAEAIS